MREDTYIKYYQSVKRKPIDWLMPFLKKLKRWDTLQLTKTFDNKELNELLRYLIEEIQELHLSKNEEIEYLKEEIKKLKKEVYK